MLDSVPLSVLAGAVLSAALIGTALLGWLGDLKRVGGSTSARETTRRSSVRQKPASGGSARRAPSRASQEQEDRIREAYFAKEQKAREFRERQRRQERARQRTREAASSAGARAQAAPPPETHDEARYRATLELAGPVTTQSLRVAYRRLIAAYHPDRCATLGVKLQKLAEEETKRINEAYAYFRRTLK